MTKMATLHYIVKILKKNLLWNRKADNHETWYAIASTQVLINLLNDAPGLTLTDFTAKSNLVPYAFVWEKVKTMDFSETIVVL